VVGVILGGILFLNFRNYELTRLIRKINPQLYSDAYVFLIADVDLCCRPLPKLTKIEEDGRMRWFIFSNDFSDIDIQNFRYYFKIPVKDQSVRMDDNWKKLFQKLNKRYNKSSVLANFSFNFSSKGFINSLRMF